MARGVANVATGPPMRADTGFLLGSIAGIVTATLDADLFVPEAAGPDALEVCVQRLGRSGSAGRVALAG